MVDGGAPFRVLAIDGGGIRGLIPARVLAALEHDAGQPTHELFDLIAGTSTGGIIALALALPDRPGGTPRPASELVRFYEEEGPKIFSPRRLGKLRRSRSPQTQSLRSSTRTSAARDLATVLPTFSCPPTRLSEERRSFSYRGRRSRRGGGTSSRLMRRRPHPPRRPTLTPSPCRRLERSTRTRSSMVGSSQITRRYVPSRRLKRHASATVSSASCPWELAT